jgi:ADP-heptose:LPS heptosyltransferase
MVGKTNLRKLFKIIKESEGVITCVSLPMHIAAAFNKPCVVVAGAREGTRWELYPNHQFLYVNGCLPCATYDGCWRSKLEDCNNKVEGTPKCMMLITPQDIYNAVNRYYLGVILVKEGVLV